MKSLGLDVCRKWWGGMGWVGWYLSSWIGSLLEFGMSDLCLNLCYLVGPPGVVAHLIHLQIEEFYRLDGEFV